MGDMSLVGPRPPVPREVKQYTLSDRKRLDTIPVNFGPEPTEDELYVAETFYAVSSDLKYDIKLLGKYFGQILGLFPKP